MKNFKRASYKYYKNIKVKKWAELLLPTSLAVLVFWLLTTFAHVLKISWCNQEFNINGLVLRDTQKASEFIFYFAICRTEILVSNLCCIEAMTVIARITVTSAEGHEIVCLNELCKCFIFVSSHKRNSSFLWTARKTLSLQLREYYSNRNFTNMQV